LLPKTAQPVVNVAVDKKVDRIVRAGAPGGHQSVYRHGHREKRGLEIRPVVYLLKAPADILRTANGEPS
jgi:glucose/arabinose dehydrogenase